MFYAHQIIKQALLNNLFYIVTLYFTLDFFKGVTP